MYDEGKVVSWLLYWSFQARDKPAANVTQRTDLCFIIGIEVFPDNDPNTHACLITDHILTVCILN